MPTPARRAWMAAWEADLTPTPAGARSAARAAARMSHRRYYTREATARVPEPAHEQLREHEQRREHEAQRPLPELRVATRRRTPWGMVVLALLFVGVVVGASIIAPVLVSAAGTGLEAQLGRLQVQQNELTASNAALSAQISALSSPERVADQATLLGLGPARSVRYVEIGTGTPVAEGDTTVAGR